MPDLIKHTQRSFFAVLPGQVFDVTTEPVGHPVGALFPAGQLAKLAQGTFNIGKGLRVGNEYRITQGS